MKILVPTQGKGGLEDLVSPVFGRAPTFTIVEVENEEIKKTEVFENPAASAFRGAGIQAAQFAAEKGVNVILTGNIGPNASMVLQQSGIEVVFGYAGLKVRDAVESYLKGPVPAQPIPQKAKASSLPSMPAMSFQPKETKIDLEFQKRLLELQKQMIEEQIAYLEKKIKELEK